ncbi:DNA-binding protein [Flavobacterium qiangtangense]|uniref:DNA-binding protein n=1 Tax=Flavobacterium qiangtangense TaxID=1442595 RepID=A0ABW1PKW2_9FLAO
MVIDLITPEDLNEFRNLLLNDLKQLIKPQTQQGKQWLKSYEFRKALNISAGTLQNLRINGTLAFTKIGGLIYYKYSTLKKS